MAKRFLTTALSRIDEAAAGAGEYKLDGKRLASFSIQLLTTASGELDEHLDIQAAAGLYYARLLAQAEEHKRKIEGIYESWYAKAYRRVAEDMTGGYKPTKDDIQHEVRNRYAVKYKKFMRLLEQAKRELQAILDWNIAWKQKSFGMEGISKINFPALVSQGERYKDEVKERLDKSLGRLRKRPK